MTSSKAKLVQLCFQIILTHVWWANATDNMPGLNSLRYFYETFHGKVYPPTSILQQSQPLSDAKLCESVCAGVAECNALEVNWKTNVCTLLTLASPDPHALVSTTSPISTKLKTEDQVALIDGNPLASLNASAIPRFSHGPEFSRLHTPAGAGNCGCWAAGSTHLREFIQADFGVARVVLAVATQGRDHTPGIPHQWVREYYLSFSDDEVQWRNYTEMGRTKFFTGNIDSANVVKNYLAVPTSTRFVRLFPTLWISYPSMRWEVYGRRICA